MSNITNTKHGQRTIRHMHYIYSVSSPVSSMLSNVRAYAFCDFLASGCYEKEHYNLENKCILQNHTLLKILLLSPHTQSTKMDTIRYTVDINFHVMLLVLLIDRLGLAQLTFHCQSRSHLTSLLLY